MHVDIDKHADLDSPIHRWDVRVRLVSLFLLLVAFACTRTVGGTALAVAIALAVSLTARIPWRDVWRRARWVFLILGPLALALPIFGDGTATRSELLLLGLVYLLRGMAILILTLPLIGTSRVTDTLAALRTLRFPSRAVTLFLFSYRYMFLFLEELRRSRLAMRVRGYRRRAGLRGWKLAAGQIGLRLYAGVERSERILHAMQVRGFRGEFPLRREFTLAAGDVTKGFIVAVIASAVVATDRLLA